MTDMFYTKEVKCPVCNNKFNVTKVKIKACIATKKDEDFCIHYKDINPAFYEIFVCPTCAYAASENSFDELNKDEILKLKDAFSGKMIQRDFCKERNLKDALDSYKLALYTANIKNAKKSTIAGICLKIAWMYRYMNDKTEVQFIHHALDNYLIAYENEQFPIGMLTEIKLMYLIGELYRQVGSYKEAIVWLNRVVSSPQRHMSPIIEKLARTQWMTLRQDARANAAPQ